MSGTAGSKVAALQYSSKSDIVCAMLRELIISGELSAAEPLRQRDLADRFGVSQTPVREALRRLQSEGLVVNDPHRGATVAASRKGLVEDNSQIRAALEPLGARLAALAITEEQIARLRELNDEMLSLAADDHTYGELNREFHFAIYEAAASPMLLSMMRLLWQAMPEGPKVTRPHVDSATQHQQLIDALAAHDPERAAEITQQHILATEHLADEISSGELPRGLGCYCPTWWTRRRLEASCYGVCSSRGGLSLCSHFGRFSARVGAPRIPCTRNGSSHSCRRRAEALVRRGPTKHRVRCEVFRFAPRPEPLMSSRHAAPDVGEQSSSHRYGSMLPRLLASILHELLRPCRRRCRRQAHAHEEHDRDEQAPYAAALPEELGLSQLQDEHQAAGRHDRGGDAGGRAALPEERAR